MRINKFEDRNILDSNYLYRMPDVIEKRSLTSDNKEVQEKILELLDEALYFLIESRFFEVAI